MNDVTFRQAGREDTPLILKFIRALADYEKMADLVVADEATLEEWIFDKGKAEVIFALAQGQEVGFALFLRDSIWRTCSSSPSTGAGGTAKPSSPSLPGSPWNGSADGWSGGVWTGTGAASTSTAPWAPRPWTNGRYTASTGTP